MVATALKLRGERRGKTYWNKVPMSGKISFVFQPINVSRSTETALKSACMPIGTQSDRVRA